MYSMTGYGKGEYKEGGIELTVEIKTVNNRYLDISVKSPKIFTAYEEAIRSQVREKLSRGHADIFIAFVDKREKAKQLFVDENAAKAYYDAALRLKTLFPMLADDFTVTSLMKSADVVRQEEAQGADDALLNALSTALGIALDNLNAMRLKEGKKLAHGNDRKAGQRHQGARAAGRGKLPQKDGRTHERGALGRGLRRNEASHRGRRVCG